MVSDSHISDIALAKDHIKGNRRIIIIPETQEGLKEFTKKITSLSGVKKIVKGVFIVEGNNEPIRKAVEEIPHISFRKVREIPKMRDKSQDAKLKRTYALVTYHLNNPTPQQKKRVQRLTARSVSVRLRPGVLLFPHLRVKDNRKYFETGNMKRLLNSKNFTKEIAKLNADYLRFTHLRIVGPRSLALVNSALERMVVRKCDKLSEQAKMLQKAVEDPKILITKLKERYTSLSLHYKDSKAKYDVIRQILSVDLDRSFKRAYNLLLRARRAINDKSTV